MGSTVRPSLSKRVSHGGHRAHGGQRPTPDRAQRPGLRRSSAALPPRPVSHRKPRRSADFTDFADGAKRSEGSADTLVRLFCGQALEPRRARRSRREPGSRTRRSASLPVGRRCAGAVASAVGGAVTPRSPVECGTTNGTKITKGGRAGVPCCHRTSPTGLRHAAQGCRAQRVLPWGVE